MGQGRFGHDRILSGVIVCHVVGNNGVFPERGSRGPCVGFWVPGSIWQRMWYFCAKFLWIKGVFYHGLCVIIYAGRIVPCLHWYLIRVIGRMTSLEWFSIWETSNNIINFNDVRKRLWKLVSMMMFSPCVFCVLPCVTSTFTVSKLARIIKQASRVGGCERVFTPVRWRQVRLSCIKWRSTFFLYFFVRPSFGRQFVIFMHDSRTWRQRTGVKTRSHPPTLLACFIIRASFETVKVLVTHGRTQKTHGENIIIETSFHKRFLTSLKLMILLLVSQIENHSNDVIRPITRIKYQCKHGTIRPA